MKYIHIQGGRGCQTKSIHRLLKSVQVVVVLVCVCVVVVGGGGGGGDGKL